MQQQQQHRQQVNRTQYQNETHWFIHSCQCGLKSFSIFCCCALYSQPVAAKIFLSRKTQFVFDYGLFFFCCSIIEFCPLLFYALSKHFYCSFCALINVNVSDFRNMYCQHFYIWPGNLLIYIYTMVDLFLFMQIIARHADLVCMLTTTWLFAQQKAWSKSKKKKKKYQEIQKYMRKTWVLFLGTTHWIKWGVSVRWRGSRVDW